MSVSEHSKVMHELIIQAIKLASVGPYIACADHLLDALRSLHGPTDEGETHH
jgi:hypothetical protein